MKISEERIYSIIGYFTKSSMAEAYASKTKGDFSDIEMKVRSDGVFQGRRVFAFEDMFIRIFINCTRYNSRLRGSKCYLSLEISEDNRSYHEVYYNEKFHRDKLFRTNIEPIIEYVIYQDKLKKIKKVNKLHVEKNRVVGKFKKLAERVNLK